MIIDLLKKTIKFIRNMITQDNIAAAQLAQIFGSELLRVQQSVSDSQTQPDIVKLNPKQFLVGQNNYANAKKIEEQQFLQKLNKEAEMLHPLPQEIPPPPSPNGGPGSYVPVHAHSASPPLSPGGGPGSYVPSTQQNNDVLILIANFLERIANKLESVDIKTKRKTIKRKPKSNKKVLLNENNV